MRKLRVLIASEPMEYGVLSYLERLFEGLDRSRCEPALAYSPHRMAPQGKRLVAGLVERGIRVRSLPFQRRVGAGDVTAVLHLLAEVRAFRPDVLHVHSTKAGLVGRAVARMLRIPVLYTPHGTSWHYTGPIVGRVQRSLERAFRRATDLLLSVCPEEASAFVREVGFHPGRVRVVRNGVRVPDRSAIRAARERMRATLGISQREIWLAFVGRLTSEKGLDALLRALRADLAVDGLLVVGDGPERASLEAEAAAATIPVRFCGYQEDVSPFLAAADVFVQPSRSEGLPFSVLEAMAHGLPVVCSDVGGIRSTVESCGRLVPPDAPAPLLAALRELVRHAEVRLALGEAARARVAKEFGVAAMLSEIHAAYEDADGLRTRGRLVAGDERARAGRRMGERIRRVGGGAASLEAPASGAPTT
jgi:glycosyltransferase involved in cell wall biosynthesis